MLKRALVSLAMVAVVSACGAKSSSTSDADAAEDPSAETTTNASLTKLDSGSDVMAYALSALSSSGGAATTALNLVGNGDQGNGSQGDGGQGSGSQGDGAQGDGSSAQGDSGQGGGAQEDPAHEKFSQCSKHGEAYKADGSGRMNASSEGYSAATIFCQLNVADSAETILGSLSQAKAVLCAVEESIGSKVQYAAEGKVYKDVKITLSKACGWSEEQIQEMGSQMPKAKFTATSYSTGDWQKSIHVELPGMVDFKMHYTVKGDILAIRKVEGWTQAERCAGSDSSCSSNGLIASTASGSRGDVIAVNLKSGELRAETTDNYWGRRARALFKGTLDSATGKFKSIDDVNFLYSSIYVNQNAGNLYVSGRVASAKGSVKTGVAYVGGDVVCGTDGSGCDIEDFATAGGVDGPGVECSVSGGCSGNAGFSWTFAGSKVLDFILLGADFDSKGGSRTKNEAWLKNAKIPTFKSVEMSSAID